MRPFLWKVLNEEYGGNWTNGHTSPAVDTVIWINIKLAGRLEPSFISSRVNHINRAGVNTGGILDINARFGDYVRHFISWTDCRPVQRSGADQS